MCFMFHGLTQFQNAHFPSGPQMTSHDRQLKVYVHEKLSEVKPLHRPPLLPERVDMFEGDEPAEEEVSAFLARV